MTATLQRYKEIKVLTLPPKLSSKKLKFLRPFSPLTILTKMNKKKKKRKRRREKGEKKTVALGSGHENQVRQDEKQDSYKWTQSKEYRLTKMLQKCQWPTFSHLTTSTVIAV